LKRCTWLKRDSSIVPMVKLHLLQINSTL